MRLGTAGSMLLIAAAAAFLTRVGATAGGAELPKGHAAAGWAEVEITPPLGIALGGRGGPETAADRVIDPLYMQVLVLRDSKGTGFVLASYDLIGLTHELSDRLRTRLLQELGVDWNLIVLNTSHTHSGPYMLRSLMAGVGPAPQVELDYFRTLEEKTVSAARAAAQAMQPVKVEAFEGTTQVGINRRGGVATGRGGMAPNPNGPFDSKVWVLKLTPSGGKAPAVVFSYACHPVIVYGYALSAVSADYPGATRKRLREALGQGAHLQFVQGFAGDIRPRVLADLDQHRFRSSRPSDLDRAARDLSDSVLAAIKSSGRELSLDIAGAADRPFLPRDKPPSPERFEKMRSQALAQTNAYRLAVSDFWLERYRTSNGFARGDAWCLGLIRLAANQWIVYASGEPCVEWKAKVSEWLSPLKVATWGYCQEARAYLPTESMLREGGYEVLESNLGRESTPAPFAPGIEGAIRDSLRRQLASIHAAGE